MSPIFIPFIGPIILTNWILRNGMPLWIVPIVWIGDVGTLAFLSELPSLTREWWQTCNYTKIATLRGSHGAESVVITFHSTGRYLFLKGKDTPDVADHWRLSLSGEYEETPDGYRLNGYDVQLVLRETVAGIFVVEELGASPAAHSEPPPKDPSPSPYQSIDRSINGWILKRVETPAKRT